MTDFASTLEESSIENHEFFHGSTCAMGKTVKKFDSHLRLKSRQRLFYFFKDVAQSETLDDYGMTLGSKFDEFDKYPSCKTV